MPAQRKAEPGFTVGALIKNENENEKSYDKHELIYSIAGFELELQNFFRLSVSAFVSTLKGRDA